MAKLRVPRRLSSPLHSLGSHNLSKNGSNATRLRRRVEFMRRKWFNELIAQ
jgi:hypothetical protein